MHLLNTGETAFLIIMLVIFGTLLAGVLGPSPIAILPISLSILVLSVRSFLKRPEKEFGSIDEEAQQRLLDEGIMPRLKEEVDQIATDLEYDQDVQLLIHQEKLEARAFGTWRRHYIFLGECVARKIDTDLQNEQERDKARALLYHEIGHLLHKDVQRIGYARDLLIKCFTLVGWWGLFLLGWLLFAILAAPLILDLESIITSFTPPLFTPIILKLFDLFPVPLPEIVEEVQSYSLKLLMSFILYTLLPIIMVSFALWLFYYRRMMRMQEFSADWLSAQMIGETGPLLWAFGRYPGWIARLDPQENKTRMVVLRGYLKKKIDLPASFKIRDTKIHWKQLFSFHPTYFERYDYLEDPLFLYNHWLREAVAIAALVVALELFMISPAAAYYLSNIPIHFVTIAIFALLSTWLLPLMTNHRPFFGLVVKTLLVVFALRLAWIMINLLFFSTALLLAPAWAIRELNGLLLAMSRSITAVDVSPIYNLSDLILWLPGYFPIQFLPLIAVSLGLLVYYQVNKPGFAVQRVSHINWHRQHWLSVFAISALLIFLLIGPVTNVYFGDFSALASPWHLLSYGLSLFLLFILWRIYYRNRNS